MAGEFDTNFIVRILLEARDNATAHVAALREEIERLKAEAAGGSATGDLTRGLDDTARSAEQAARSQELHTRSVEHSVRSNTDAVRSHQAVTGALNEQVEIRDRLTEAYKEGTKAQEESSDSEQALRRRIDELTGAYEDFDRSVRKGQVTVEDQRRSYSAFSSELQNLARRLGPVGDEFQRIQRLSEQARSRSLSIGFDPQSLRNTEQQIRAISSAYEKFNANVRSGAINNDDARRGYQSFAADLQKIARGFDSGSESAAKFGRMAEDARTKATSIQISTKTVNDAALLATHIENVTRNYDNFIARVRGGQMGVDEVRRGYKDFSRDLGTIARGFDAGSAEAERFGVMAEQAANRSKNAAREAAGGWKNPFDNLAAIVDNVGIKIVSLSAQLRGLLLAGAVGFAQPLDTALVSLAGSLFSVASAAAEAGAALGGAFVAGIAQAMPVVTVFLGAVQRIQSIFQAVQLATSAQQQQAMDPTHQQQAQLENANQMQSAQNSLADSYLNLYNAQEQVRTSQEALTQARIDAIRNITDLTMAERNAALQQAGAHLTLDQAQQQLQADIARGVTGVALSQAELAVRSARFGADQADIQQPRSVADAMRAHRRGVEGAQNVRAAEQAARQAREQVIRARQSIASARRGEQLAQLRSSAPGFGLTGPQQQLNYLESQMSGAERSLFNALLDIEKQLKSPNSPLRRISDAIITPIASAFQTLDKIFRDPRAMRSLQQLADAIGKGIGGLARVFLGPQGRGFFDLMARDAAQNAPIVFQILDRLVSIFEAISKAASPVLRDVLQGIDDFLGRITTKLNDPGRSRTGTPSGLDRLEVFFQNAEGYLRKIGDFIGAFGHLLRVLGGAAAPAGGQLITDMANALDRMSTWVQTHSSEVQQFFDQARQGIELVGHVIGGLALQMIHLFDLGSLKTFSEFLLQYFLPAIRDVLTVIGKVVQFVMDLANAIPGGRQVLEGIAAAIVVLIGFGKVYGPLMTAYKAIKLVWETWKGLELAIATFKVTGSLGAAVSVFEGYMKRMKTAADTTKVAIEEEQAVASTSSEISGGAVAAEGAAATGAAEAGAGAAGAGAAAEGAGGAAASAAGGVALGRVLTFAARIAPWAIAAEQLINADTAGQTPQKEEGMLFQARRSSARFENVGQLQVDQQYASNQIRQLQQQLNYVNQAIASSGNDWVTKVFKQQRDGIQQSIRDWQGYFQQVSSEKFQKTFGTVGQIVSGAFKNINDNAAILPQVAQIVNGNMSLIASDLGTKSAAGRKAVAANMIGSAQAIEAAMHSGMVSTSRGMAAIGHMMGAALKALGVRDTHNIVADLHALGGNLNDIGDPNSISSQIYTSLQQAGLTGPAEGSPGTSGDMGYGGGRARGGWIPASQGGRPYRVGEGGYKEMVLTTDPQEAPRQRDLLGQYLRSAPHMAVGGRVRGSNLVFPFPGNESFSWARVDQGQDLQGPAGGPVVAIGSGMVTIGHDSFSGFGPFYPILHLDPQFGGSEWYYGHAKTTRTGHVARGQAIGVTQDRANEWTAAPAGWLEFGPFPIPPFHTAGGGLGGQPAANLLHAIAGGHSFVSAAQTIQALRAPQAGGSGAWAALSQAVLNRMTAAANQYLRRQGGGFPPGARPANIPSGGGRIGTMGLETLWTQAGGPHPIAWLMAQIALAESGGWPLRNYGEPPPGTGARGGDNGVSRAAGLWQILGHPAGVSGNVYDPYVNALMAVAKWRQQGLGAWATDTAFNKYVPGHFRLGPGIYDVGGMVAPWGGRPVPIIAHEGERVVNPPQWSALAHLAGTTSYGLDRYMGYNGQPRQHFQAGGAPGAWSPSQPFLTVPAPHLPGIVSLDANVSSVMSVLNAVIHGFSEINKHVGTGSKFGTTFKNFVDQITSVLLPQLSANFSTYQGIVSHRIASISYSRIRDPFAPSGARLGSGKTGVAIADPTTIDEATIGGYQDQGTYLQGENRIVNRTLSQVNRQITRAAQVYRKHRTAANRSRLGRLTAQKQNLVGARRGLAGQIDDNTASLYQAQQQLVQDQLTATGNAFAVEQGGIQNNESGTGQSQLQALGNFAALSAAGGPDELMAASLRRQVSSLQPILDRARAMGDTNTVAQITQQMQQLQGQITGAVIQQINDAQQAVGQAASKFQSSNALLGIQASIATSNNDFSRAGALTAQMLNNSLDANQSGSLQWQLNQYNDLISKAQAAGDVGEVATLQQSIDQLTGEIAQNQQALKDNTAQVVAQTTAYVQNRAQFATGVYGGLAGIINTIGQITGSTDTASLIKLYGASNTSLIGANKSLISGPNGLDAFLASIGRGPSGLAGLSGSALVSALAGMDFPGLESGMDSTQQQTFEGIINAIISNTSAIESNTQQINTLNGQLMQPQGWSTTSWTALRMAIFNGMGGLLPQYSSVLPAGAVPNTPVFGSAAPAAGAPTIGTLNIEHPVEKLDPAVLGQQLHYQLANAPPTS